MDQFGKKVANVIKLTMQKMLKKSNGQSILSLGFSLVVKISCIVFVGWKSTECFMKYLNHPRGSNLDIKNSGDTAQFPTLTICAVDSDNEPPGLRWNISYLNKCGIKG